MFENNSRYYGIETLQVRDSRGRMVTVVTPPDAPVQGIAGVHRLKQAQRLDHLAHRYLDDATSWWRIVELADVMLPDALAEVQEVLVPKRSG
ncbi:hypothetical protein BH09MYX1_BH09MYX1_08470 [soil metagenome]